MCLDFEKHKLADSSFRDVKSEIDKIAKKIDPASCAPINSGSSLADSKTDVYSSSKALLQPHGSGSYYSRPKLPRSERNTSPPLTQSRVDSEELAASKLQSRRLDQTPRPPKKPNPNEETGSNIWARPEYLVDKRDGVTAKITQISPPKMIEPPQIHVKNRHRPHQDSPSMPAALYPDSHAAVEPTHRLQSRERKTSSHDCHDSQSGHYHVDSSIHGHHSEVAGSRVAGRGSQRTIASPATGLQHGKKHSQRPSSADNHRRAQDHQNPQAAKLQEKLNSKRNMIKENRANVPTAPPSEKYENSKHSRTAAGGAVPREHRAAGGRRSSQSGLLSIKTENHSDLVSSETHSYKMDPIGFSVPLKSPSNHQLATRVAQRPPDQPEAWAGSFPVATSKQPPKRSSSQSSANRKAPQQPAVTSKQHSSSNSSHTPKLQASPNLKQMPPKPSYSQVESKIKSLIKRDKEQFGFNRKIVPEVVEFLTEEALTELKDPNEECTFRSFENKQPSNQPRHRAAKEQSGNTLEISRDESRSSIASSTKLLGGRQPAAANKWRESKDDHPERPSSDQMAGSGVMEIANKLLSSDILNRFKGKTPGGQGVANQPPVSKASKLTTSRKEEKDPDPFASQKSGLGKQVLEQPKSRRFEEDDISSQGAPPRREWNQNTQSDYFDPPSSHYTSTYQKHRSEDRLEQQSHSKADRVYRDNHLASKHHPASQHYGSDEDDDRFGSGPRFADGSRKEKFNREDYEINFNETSRVSSSQFSAFCPNDEMKSFFKKEFLDNHSQAKDKDAYHTIGEITNNSSKLTYGPNSIFLEKKLSGRSHQKDEM